MHALAATNNRGHASMPSRPTLGIIIPALLKLIQYAWNSLLFLVTYVQQDLQMRECSLAASSPLLPAAASIPAIGITRHHFLRKAP